MSVETQKLENIKSTQETDLNQFGYKRIHEGEQQQKKIRKLGSNQTEKDLQLQAR